MTATEDRLAALFAEDDPPARDPGFRIEVMQGIERRKARTQILLLLAVGVLTTLVLGSLAPVMTPMLINSGGLIAALFVAAALVWASVVAVRQGVPA